jgi:magnesium-transporting ATPase (P-type)
MSMSMKEDQKQRVRNNAKREMDRKIINKKPPIIIKIISIIFYISVVLTLGNGLYILLSGGDAMLVEGKYDAASQWKLILIWIIVIAILKFFVGRGLWLGKNWARITAIILGILMGSHNLLLIVGRGFALGNGFNLIIDYGIALFLLIDKDSTQHFKEKQEYEKSQNHIEPGKV